MESDLVRRWSEKLRKLGAFAERASAFDLTTSRGLMRRGFPDLIVVYKGVPIFIEAKKNRTEWIKWMHDKSEQAPAQKRCITELRQAGAIAFCTYRWEPIQLALDEIDCNEWHSGARINMLIDKEQGV